MILKIKNGQQFEVNGIQTGVDIDVKACPPILWFETFQDQEPTCRKVYPDELFTKRGRPLVRYSVYSEDVLSIEFN